MRYYCKGLKVLRERYQMEQKQMAKEIGISKFTMSKIEREEAPTTIGVLECLAKLFRVETTSLYNQNEGVEVQRNSNIKHTHIDNIKPCTNTPISMAAYKMQREDIVAPSKINISNSKLNELFKELDAFMASVGVAETTKSRLYKAMDLVEDLRMPVRRNYMIEQQADKSYWASTVDLEQAS